MIEEGFKRFDGATITAVFQDSVTFSVPNGETRFAELHADYLQAYRYKSPDWNEPMVFVPADDNRDKFKGEILSLLADALTNGTKTNLVIAVVKKNVNVEIITRIEFA